MGWVSVQNFLNVHFVLNSHRFSPLTCDNMRNEESCSTAFSPTCYGVPRDLHSIESCNLAPKSWLVASSIQDTVDQYHDHADHRGGGGRFSASRHNPNPLPPSGKNSQLAECLPITNAIKLHLWLTGGPDLPITRA